MVPLSMNLNNLMKSRDIVLSFGGISGVAK